MLVERMSLELGLPKGYLKSVARSASHRYKIYGIPKRSGGERIISHPARELKALQRWLLREVLRQLPVHEAAVAYRSGLGLRQGAERHLGQKYLLRMDIKNFFPSITKGDLELYFTEGPGQEVAGVWTKDDLSFLCSIVCRQDKLTIGAPTSPQLSNAICLELDQELSEVCGELDVRYSRYADDLFFSTTHPHILRKIEHSLADLLKGLRIPSDLRIRSEKTKHASARGQMRVTGLVLTPDGAISIGRKRKRWLKGCVHRYPELSPEERASLAGWLAFCRDVEPEFVERLVLKFGPRRVRQARTVEPNLE